MANKLLTLEKQIQRLREKRNKLYTQQAVLFYKEVEKIFKDGFCRGLVLDILTQTYETASAIQQQEWEKRAPSFRTRFPDSNCKKPQTTEAAHHQG
ncbi:MAG: hypothetical protein BGO67_07095 [Alphaproteobacteria bacterium 41-28]|nr:MAG: hypothetical protein BGO67_07095 [Alphaproteobacteria bacterium 41-28]